MKFLKKLSAMHPERGVKYYLHAQLAKWEPARPIKTIHASALTKTGVEFCPREYALMDLLKIKPANEFVPTATAVTWAQGRLGQDQLVGWLADAGRAVCDWKCAACGTVAKLMKRPPACSTCQCKVLLPIEPRFISLVSGASCGVDTLADLGYPKLRVVEIKTVLKDEFV